MLDNISVEQDTIQLTEQINVGIADAYERGKTDINFFAALAMPTVCIAALPAFYIAVWQILTLRNTDMIGKLLRFALGLPRGHAKTTFIKVIIAWLIVYDKASFILIICANSTLAERLLADINDILCSPNIVSIYGLWEESLAIDSADTKKAAYHNRDVILVANGWKAGNRGLNIKNRRPDVIFCDDAQTKDNDESPTEREHLMQELNGSIFKAIDNKGDRLIIYVGNMYSEECILYKFKQNSKWISMITGAILENGQPLWPQLFSLEELMESYEHDEELGLAHIWFAEVMNDPKSTATALLRESLPQSPYVKIDEPDGAFITIDPAGFRKNSDNNVIACHYIYDQKGYIVESNIELNDPSAICQAAISMALRHGCSLIGVEGVGYQQTLGFWINFWLKERNINGIHVVELSPHGRSKESRIKNFVAELIHKDPFTKELQPSYYILDANTRRLFVWQANLYKIGKKDNKDDLLDAIAYGIDVRKEYWHLITRIKRNLIENETNAVIGNNTPF